jgi:hypothetical protein
MAAMRFLPPSPASTAPIRGQRASPLASNPGCPQSPVRQGTLRLLRHIGALGQLTATSGEPARARFEALEPELASLVFALAEPRGH